MLKRRQFLGTMAVAGAALPSIAALSRALIAEAVAESPTQKRGIAWRNWSGHQHCVPAARKAPANVAELQQILASSPTPIRPVGAGHSFTALVPSDGTIVSLGRLSGLLSHDAEQLQAVVGAGSRLSDLGQPLAEIGQAMINMPDIDEQSLAGALATSTHGTGATLGAMPTTVTGLQIVTAAGEIINCDQQQHPEIFQAARVSLGALGVVTEVRLQNTELHQSRSESWILPFEELLENADQLADNNRNFEFYYIPFSGMGMASTHNITDETAHTTPRQDANEVVELLMQVRDWLSWSPWLREQVLSTGMSRIDKEVVVEASWRNYASERNVRFNEMEYHLPREYGLQAVREIRDTIEKNHPEVFFPIEYRYVRSDDIWLSPFYGRDTCSIAVHRYYEEDFEAYFKSIEPIFRKYHGRPHWGKLNSLAAPQFAELYPRWQDFIAVRQQLDPEGKFLNPYLKQVFGVA
jgi:FAD-linked oxidoreductase